MRGKNHSTLPDELEVPPHSEANEEAVIGAAVLDGEQFDRIHEILGS